VIEDLTNAAALGRLPPRAHPHGYAITVHSAQGVTADTTHAVLKDWFFGASPVLNVDGT
jgi:hypothetical protein